VEGLNLRSKTIKLLEGSINENLHDLEPGNGSFDITIKAKATEEK
jgi:hypothetical protein